MRQRSFHRVARDAGVRLGCTPTSGAPAPAQPHWVWGQPGDTGASDLPAVCEPRTCETSIFVNRLLAPLLPVAKPSLESVIENIPKSPADAAPWHGLCVRGGRGGGASLETETSPLLRVGGGWQSELSTLLLAHACPAAPRTARSGWSGGRGPSRVSHQPGRRVPVQPEWVWPLCRTALIGDQSSLGRKTKPHPLFTRLAGPPTSRAGSPPLGAEKVVSWVPFP